MNTICPAIYYKDAFNQPSTIDSTTKVTQADVRPKATTLNTPAVLKSLTGPLARKHSTP